MTEQIYIVPFRFQFDGEFKIRAKSQEQANEYAQMQCGLVMGGHIHSTLPDEDVDWDFPTHPEKVLL